tara:strand:+ start:722 stop:1138 length:417 start_codon:yes stop_codon:yes gene_type:complete
MTLVWTQESSIAMRSRGLGIGVFSGCFPFFGFQILLSLFLSTFFRGNRILAVAGTWVSNPLTYLPLYWFNYQIGSHFINSKHVVDEITISTFTELLSRSWLLSSRLLLGSTLVGAFMGLLAGLSLYVILHYATPRKNR